jgi:hypothetical protein
LRSNTRDISNNCLHFGGKTPKNSKKAFLRKAKKQKSKNNKPRLSAKPRALLRS